MTIRGKPDVSEFLLAVATDKVGRKKINIEKEKPRQKIFLLPAKMLIDLKRRALDETEQGGSGRVTENDIIKRALETYLYG